MEYLTPVYDMLTWAVKNNLISVSTAVGILFLIYAHCTSQKTFKDTVKTITDAKDAHIAEQKEDKAKCEERYSILRNDVTLMQQQVNEQANWMLKAALGGQNGNNPQT